jgi:hypothetical protein
MLEILAHLLRRAEGIAVDEVAMIRVVFMKITFVLLM